MSLVLEGAVPPPHLLQSASTSKSYSYPPYDYLMQASSPAPMSPRSFNSYLSRPPQSPLHSEEFKTVPSSNWYSPSISAPDCHNSTTYGSYSHYMPAHASSTILSPSPVFHYPARTAVPTLPSNQSVAAASPVSTYSRESVVSTSARPSEEPQAELNHAVQQPATRLRAPSAPMELSHSASSPLHQTPAPDLPWAINPLAMHSPHPTYFPNFPAQARSPSLSEPILDLSPDHLASPRSQRYPLLAPQPVIPRSQGVKRLKDDEDDAPEDAKRRKRSDSNTSTTFELGEEDRLLLQLKEEESMPWKDIAARFQSDLGKAYQIPALQMRLKRLRERMRVWTDVDVRALRMAHEYWAQNKFDIISQKMLEFGAQEKWTARQCTRKWAEIDPAQPSFPHYETHLQHGFAPYAMSPVEPPNAYLSYMHAT